MSQQVFHSLSGPIREALAESGIQSPTPPQTVAIPKIMAGGNILLIAPTGSGKTEAVLLPILDRCAATARRLGA
jgi:ATP-dependent Lhr-like helicase